VAGLKDVSGIREPVNYVVQFAPNPNIGGVLHRGQRNDATAADVQRLFPSLQAWRNALAQLTDGGLPDGFSNDFTRRAGLEV
jgi:hypothetical protein